MWNRTNYFTPIHKLKEMMLYISNNKALFSKFEIFDAGSVAMNQHDFVRLLLEMVISSDVSKLELVKYTKFDREISTTLDKRLIEFYPIRSDITKSVTEMVLKYQVTYSNKIRPL